jgi:hypothetical protein
LASTPRKTRGKHDLLHKSNAFDAPSLTAQNPWRKMRAARESFDKKLRGRWREA